MEEFDCSKLKYCGKDVRISGNVIIKYPELVSIGNHAAIDGFCYISTALEIGDYVHISPFCSIIGGRNALCVLKDFAGFAAGCRIICGSDDYLGSGMTNPTVPAPYRADLNFEPVIFEKHSLLGTNCVVLPGVTLGEGTVAGSCSLITKSLDPWKIYLGVPAKLYKERQSAKILEMEATLRREIG